MDSTQIASYWCGAARDMRSDLIVKWLHDNMNKVTVAWLRCLLPLMLSTLVLLSVQELVWSGWTTWRVLGRRTPSTSAAFLAGAKPTAATWRTPASPASSKPPRSCFSTPPQTEPSFLKPPHGEQRPAGDTRLNHGANAKTHSGFIDCVVTDFYSLIINRQESSSDWIPELTCEGSKVTFVKLPPEAGLRSAGCFVLPPVSEKKNWFDEFWRAETRLNETS